MKGYIVTIVNTQTQHIFIVAENEQEARDNHHNGIGGQTMSLGWLVYSVSEMPKG